MGEIHLQLVPINTTYWEAHYHSAPETQPCHLAAVLPRAVPSNSECGCFSSEFTPRQYKITGGFPLNKRDCLTNNLPSLPHGQLPHSTGSPGQRPAPPTTSQGQDLVNSNGSDSCMPSDGGDFPVPPPREDRLLDCLCRSAWGHFL